jgi:hypothetical protein
MLRIFLYHTRLRPCLTKFENVYISPVAAKPARCDYNVRLTISRFVVARSLNFAKRHFAAKVNFPPAPLVPFKFLRRQWSGRSFTPLPRSRWLLRNLLPPAGTVDGHKVTLELRVPVRPKLYYFPVAIARQKTENEGIYSLYCPGTFARARLLFQC